MTTLNGLSEHPALTLARAIRRGADKAGPSRIYALCEGDGALYNHALREAGYIVRKDTLQPENPCSTCGWTPDFEALRDVDAAVATLPEEEQKAYRDAQRSVIDARRSANANEGQRWIG